MIHLFYHSFFSHLIVSTSRGNSPIDRDTGYLAPGSLYHYLVHYCLNEQTKTVKVEALFHTSLDPMIWDERTQY